MNLLEQFAKSKKATSAQIALAWMLHKWNFLVPIPGMRSLERIKENLSASWITLSDYEFHCIEDELSKVKIYGDRTDEDIAKLREML